MEAVNAIMQKINEEADSALNELNRTAQLVLDNIEEKYQETLFLYNLLEEKKKELVELSDMMQTHNTHKRKTRDTAAPVVRSVPARTGNARHIKIKELSKQGLSVQEIAKSLDMGQGEVKLIMELTGS